MRVSHSFPTRRSSDLDLGAALACTFHDGVDSLLGQEIGEGNSRHRRIARQRHHVVAMTAEHERVHVFHTDLALHCYERDRKSTRLNSSHTVISYAVFC